MMIECISVVQVYFLGQFPQNGYDKQGILWGYVMVNPRLEMVKIIVIREA